MTANRFQHLKISGLPIPLDPLRLHVSTTDDALPPLELVCESGVVTAIRRRNPETPDPRFPMPVAPKASPWSGGRDNAAIPTYQAATWPRRRFRMVNSTP